MFVYVHIQCIYHISTHGDHIYIYIVYDIIYIYIVYDIIYRIYTAWVTCVLYTLDMLYSYACDLHTCTYVLYQLYPVYSLHINWFIELLFFLTWCFALELCGKNIQKWFVRSPMKNGQSLRKTSRCQTRKTFDGLTVDSNPPHETAGGGCCFSLQKREVWS